MHMAHCCDTREGKWNPSIARRQQGDLYLTNHPAEYHYDAETREGDLMQIDYPYHFDSRGHTAETTSHDHIRDMIEQILFTSPGERVNRPDFGCGIQRLIFTPNSDAIAAATQVIVQGSLQQWMGDLIEVEGVDVQNVDSSLIVLVQYVVRLTQEQRVDKFVQGV